MTHWYSATDSYPAIYFPERMRANPSITFSSSTDLLTIYSEGGSLTTTGIGTNAGDNTIINFRASTSSVSVGRVGHIEFNSGKYISLNSEL